MDWTPFLSFIGGGAVTLGSVELQARRQSARERDKWQTERTAVRDDRRDALQRETLLAVQEAMSALARLAGQVHMADVSHWRSGGAGRGLISDEVDQADRETNAQLTMLKTRINDRDIRDAVDRFQLLANAVALMTDTQMSEHALGEASDALTVANEAIGDKLHKLY